MWKKKNLCVFYIEKKKKEKVVVGEYPIAT
jgi:hypothetical protein